MTVYKRKDRDGAWEYEFVRRGRRHRAFCLNSDGTLARTKTEAKAAEAIAKADAIKGQQAVRSIVRAGDFTLSMAQAKLVQRVIDRRRKKTHLDNITLWGDEALLFFGPDTAFQDLTQKRLEEYAAHLGRQTVRRWRGGRRRPTAGERGDAKQWVDTGRPLSKRQVNNYLRHFQRLLSVAAKVRDPVTRLPVLAQDPPLEIELERMPRRRPRPMPDIELAARLAELPPWTRDVVELSRLFGLRAGECLRLEVRHIDDDARGLFFRGEEAKSGHDEPVFGGAAGWQLLQRLKRQAIARGTTFLVTIPVAPRHVQLAAQGKALPADAGWRPLRTLGNAWRRSAERARIGDKPIDGAHRFHDVRARYITEVAKVDKAAARGAARHRHSVTTDLYIGVADDEISRAVATAIARRPKPPATRRLRAVK